MSKTPKILPDPAPKPPTKGDPNPSKSPGHRGPNINPRPGKK